ncbi:MAG TPA: hypothetical protein VD884_05055 [Ohtaekwangia sp.]|nr:hypothetical protein [Ohtaekwangia sp.]
MAAAHVEISKLKRQVQILIALFISGLVFSGITAFPIEAELQIAQQWMENLEWNNRFSSWIQVTYKGVKETNSKYPFIAYGSDWLAFAHLVIAIAFGGPLRDPVKNIWVIEFGMIACLAIFPLAFIAGPLRQIPLFWQCIDCSFGIVGFLLLWSCHKKITMMRRAG